MKNIILIICILLLISCSPDYTNKVNIQLDKKVVMTGEMVTARLYINHNDSIAPTFYVLDGLDTARLSIDVNDNNCGLFRGAYRTMGEKEFNGFVDFLDKKSKRQTVYYTIKFKVESLPTIPPKIK
jgi:hypothetical protein